MEVDCEQTSYPLSLGIIAPWPGLRYRRHRDCSSCHRRLGTHPDPQGLAVYRLLGYRPVEQTRRDEPKPYHLPTEILIRILEYLELIAPFDLEWSPDRGLVPFDCCKTCTATLVCCTCSHYHGFYSETCTCWRLSLSLFLVSRHVHNIAKSISKTPGSRPPPLTTT